MRRKTTQSTLRCGFGLKNGTNRAAISRTLSTDGLWTGIPFLLGCPGKYTTLSFLPFTFP